MRSVPLSSLLLIALVASIAGAQQFTTVFPGTFVDISTTGGTAITGVGDDTAHTIITTIGNQYFSAGSVTIGNNGAATSVAGRRRRLHERDDSRGPGEPGRNHGRRRHPDAVLG